MGAELPLTIGGSFGAKRCPVLIGQADAHATGPKKPGALIGSLFNSLRSVSQIMVDTILMARRDDFGTDVGRSDPVDVRRFDTALPLALGVGAPA